MVGWPTTTTRDWKNGKSNLHGVNARPLSEVVMLAGWATPDAQVMNDGGSLETWDARQVKNKEKHGNGNGAGMPLVIQCKIISGLTPGPYIAGTEKPAAFQLNPHFSRWLMGFPPEWCACADMAMQSFLKLRRSSSKRQRKLSPLKVCDILEGL